MPLFRIMGGGGQPARNNNNNNNNNNNRQQPPPQNPRNTYPGMRAQAPPPPRRPAPVGLPTPPPRSGHMAPPNHGGRMTASAPSMSHSLSASNYNSNSATSTAAMGNPSVAAGTGSTSTTTTSTCNTTVLRGSQVEAGARAPPPATAVTNENTATRPGAYLVSRTTVGPAQVYRVTVPTGVRPGAEFTVHAGPRRVRVRCPPTSSPGQSLQITLPPEPVTHHVPLHMAPITAAVPAMEGGGAVPMAADVYQINQQAAVKGGPAQTFLVTIPPNIYPGMQFTVNVAGGQKFMVTCPETSGPNMKVRIVPPVMREEPEAAPKTQVFEVAVPAGVRPGQPFALVANGQRVLVTCPPNVAAGQKIRFQLPVSQVAESIKLAYESQGGWSRTIRVTDLKFQWIRLEASDTTNSDDKKDKLKNGADLINLGNNVDVEGMQSFDFTKSAYVRQLTFLEGNDARMRTGKLELVPADQAVVDSRLTLHNRSIVTYSDIAEVQEKPLEDKMAWFENVCTQLTSAWEDGHIKLVIRRKHLLLDSVDAVMSLGRDDLRKRWRIEFLGEPAIDAGGVAREWFQLVTEQIFDADSGLWLPSFNNQMSCTINPSSGMSCPEDHLIYFRFLGRIIGRALFDRQIIKGHMVRAIYKHLLGWPITFEDIQAQDEEYYNSLKKLTKMEDISLMCLDFTATEESLGVRTEVELVEGGAMKEVTNENISEYLEAQLLYRMLERTKPQLTELLLGFFDVVPEPALTVFDANELELILCGLPTIDMADWQANTRYSGLFEVKGKRDQVVEWFWEVVEDDFDTELKARLLQFVTGTSGVPSRGFSVLQGIDGNIKKFTIHGVDRDSYMFPRAHTCFNRIDLPNYPSKKDLFDRLKTAVTMCSVGFGIE